MLCTKTLCSGENLLMVAQAMVLQIGWYIQGIGTTVRWWLVTVHCITMHWFVTVWTSVVQYTTGAVLSTRPCEGVLLPLPEAFPSARPGGVCVLIDGRGPMTPIYSSSSSSSSGSLMPSSSSSYLSSSFFCSPPPLPHLLGWEVSLPWWMARLRWHRPSQSTQWVSWDTWLGSIKLFLPWFSKSMLKGRNRKKKKQVNDFMWTGRTFARHD